MLTHINPPKSTQGLSLIEVLIAITVLGIGLISVMQLQATILKDGSYARKRSEAVNLALEKIEQFRNFPATPNLASLKGDTDNIQGSISTFHRGWQVTSLDNGQVKVNVEVAWPNEKGKLTKDSTVNFTTLISSFVPGASSIKHQATPAYYLTQEPCEDSPSTTKKSTPGKIKLCHTPPGNPSNKHTISVSLSAVQAHMTQHVDIIGPCPSEESDDNDNSNSNSNSNSNGNGNNNIAVCHVPPGNPENQHTLYISQSAVTTHLTQHTDYLGMCADDTNSQESTCVIAN